MAQMGVRGNGPIEITDSAGHLVALPLSALFFDGGQLQVSGALYTAHKAVFDPLLQELSDEGLIVPDVQPPPVPAVVVTAKVPGAAGNDIQLTFSNPRQNPSDNTQRILDANLTQRDVYPRVDLTQLGTVLGSSADTGRPAGLVFLSSSGTPTAPKEGTYAAGHCCIEPERRHQDPARWRLYVVGRRQEGLEPLDRSHDLPRLSRGVEAVGRGDRPMQQSRQGSPEAGRAAAR